MLMFYIDKHTSPPENDLRLVLSLSIAYLINHFSHFRVNVVFCYASNFNRTNERVRARESKGANEIKESFYFSSTIDQKEQPQQIYIAL